MIRDLFSFFSHDLGIDLGTANILVHVRGKGIAIREPSLVVRHNKTRQVIAVGRDAKKMLGKTPGTISAIKPLEHGVISDFDAAKYLLQYYIRQLHQFRTRIPQLARPRVVVGIPSGVTEVERRAVWEAALSAGARACYLIEEPMAAVIGAGVNVFEPTGVMTVDIGGGTTEIAVISLGGIVVNRSLRVAGADMDQAIINYIRLRHGLIIGEKTAEDLKIKIGSVYENGDKKKGSDKTNDERRDKVALIRGRDIETGLPRSLRINAAEVREAMSPVASKIVEQIFEVIEETPPELTSDILEYGVLLTGGGSLIPGMDSLIIEHAKIPVTLVTDPLTTVVRGTGKLLEDEQLLNHVKVTGGLR